jgi:tape measure domain-containing protein
MAQLELSVVLNLANFRTQLGKLAQASAAYYYPINLTIDKQAFKKQLAALGNIKPVIKINDSQLDGARARIATLNKSLATLRRATSTPIEIKLKYVEVGKPSSAAAGQIGRAVSGGVRGGQAVESFNYKQLQATRQMMQAAKMPVGSLGGGRSVEAYLNSIVEGFKNASEESINGLASGLKSGNSEIATAAKKVGEAGVRAIKDSLGIASPSRVFKQIGEFSVDGLELGFLNGLKDFKSKSIAEIKKIVALMRFELAKVSDVSGMGGPSMGSLRRQLVGQRAYTSPIGPQPLGSKTPWAAGSAGQFGSSGFEPRMVSRPYGQAYPAAPGSFLQFSRGAGQYQQGAVPPGGRTPGSFLGFSQMATQVAQAAQRSGGGGTVPPGGLPFGGMLGGRQGPSTFIGPGSQMEKFKTVLDVAAASTRNFTASQIPLIGGIKSLAGEFGQATKQVLLYGAAYKGLAFLTSLPGQVLDAAKSQQQFNNGLKVATQDTGTFAKELLYVDNVQRAFGLNLETTRTGFTRLYASMAPTGFDSGSIEKLFTGISAATASLQLTPDKAERVIYAFGQMASKGQIMSEELKGQLGDVLPGALAIFSKAAGMSVKEFSKAMEDGEFVGNRFREVFAKVSDELMNRFGTGAQVAGRSLQGLINTVGGDFQRTLESFAPLANAAAQATLGPLTGMLREVSMAAQIAMGEQDRVRKQL